METVVSVPRDFYDGIVSIREALLEYSVDEDAVEEVLDEIERLIVDALEQSESDTGEGLQGEKPSPK